MNSIGGETVQLKFHLHGQWNRASSPMQRVSSGFSVPCPVLCGHIILSYSAKNTAHVVGVSILLGSPAQPTPARKRQEVWEEEDVAAHLLGFVYALAEHLPSRKSNPEIRLGLQRGDRGRGRLPGRDCQARAQPGDFVTGGLPAALASDGDLWQWCHGALASLSRVVIHSLSHTHTKRRD